MADTGDLDENIYSNARPVDVHTWSDYPEVNDFVDQVFEMMKGFKGNKSIGKKLSKVLLLDLYVAWCGDPTLKLMISRNNNSYQASSRYNALFISRKIVDLVDFLIGAGLIHQKDGFNDRLSGVGYQSRIWPANDLIGLFEQARFSQFMIENFIERETVILRDKDKKVEEYPDSDETNRMRSILRDYNQLLSNTFIDIPSLETPALIMGQGTRKTTMQINQKGKLVHRIFNNSLFTQGGRFYGGWWQRCPKGYRSEITMDGVPTSEIDYSGLHIVILYAQAGINYWAEVNEDPYLIEGIAHLDPAINLRSAAKILMLTAINAEDNRKTFGAFRQQAETSSAEKKLTDEVLGRILSQLKRKHAPIAHKIASGAGIDLMYVDSQITEIITQRFTERGIPMLSVHDSYIVPFGYDHFLRETMDAAFEQVTGVTHPLVSHTGDYPENLVPVEEMVASQQISDRHIRDLNLFKQFKGKGDRPEWMPVLDQFY